LYEIPGINVWAFPGGRTNEIRAGDANFKPHDGVHTEKLRGRPIAATHRYALNLIARQIQKAPALEARASYQGRKMLPLTTYGTAR
jgi:hypothetical protein